MPRRRGSRFLRLLWCGVLAAIASLTPSVGAQAPRADATQTQRGSLTRGDEQLESGEFVDTYSYRWQARQRVTVELISSNFDGYLVLVPPSGDQIENDEADDNDADRALIETDLTGSGTYKVLVTSYEPGETGDYTLRVSATGTRRDANRTEPLAFGQTRNERLAPSDDLVDEKFVDAYGFTGRAGDRITLEMSSDDIDTYLTLVPPDGGEITDDDGGADTNTSRIAITLRQSGQYRVLASSYDDRETGPYRLNLQRPARAAAPERDPAPAPTGRGNVYGVFVGISDYEGEDNDLEYTADDARMIGRALALGGRMRDGDAVTLVDRQATGANVRRAIAEIGRRAGPDDLFVFFFSGHGDRVQRAGRQAADPDGFDETISLYDGDVSDDEMNTLLAPVPGAVLLILDSCFSGGFSKDVISSPRRMGLFSSEEDVTSGVADKFRAGGYLSKFFADAVGERRADKDRDGAITALELSQYLHERYRADVKSSRGGAENFVSTGGRDTGYQHLVVDRGSISPFDVLFRF